MAQFKHDYFKCDGCLAECQLKTLDGGIPSICPFHGEEAYFKKIAKHIKKRREKPVPRHAGGSP